MSKAIAVSPLIMIFVMASLFVMFFFLVVLLAAKKRLHLVH